MAVRKAIRELSSQELTKFRDATSRMKALSDERGYSHFAGIHGLLLPATANTARCFFYLGTGRICTSLNWHFKIKRQM